MAGFWDKDHLRSCTLSRDTTTEVTIKETNGASRTQNLSCRAEAPIEMELLGHGDLGVCTLVVPAEIGGVACAAGTELKLVNGMLYSCTVAKQTRFGPIELPPGSLVAYSAARPGWFRLPAAGPAVDGFGLSLPAGTEAGFCYQSEALQRLAVDQAAYVTVEGVKLTALSTSTRPLPAWRAIRGCDGWRQPAATRRNRVASRSVAPIIRMNYSVAPARGRRCADSSCRSSGGDLVPRAAAELQA